MSNDMADGSNVGLIVSLGSVIGTIIAIVTFWTKFSDRITRADQKAADALQDAAEAKNDLANFREVLDGMTRTANERTERMGRDNGEALAAIRQHVTDLALFVRDEFVRHPEFLAAMSKIEAGQLRTETKLDRLGEQMRLRQ